MVQKHDPYNEMIKEVKGSVKPSLPGDDSRKKEKASKAEDGLSAKSELQDAESNAEGGFYDGGASKEAKVAEEQPDSFKSSVQGEKGKLNIGNKKKSFAKKSAFGVIIFVIAVVAIALFALNQPIFRIGHLDFNLQDALGFTKTSGILQKVATHIIKKKLSKGEVPAALMGDLAEHGIDVGQVTAQGDFVRTNVYIADVEKLKDLAVVGHVEAVPSEGELAVLYDGEVIKADDFIATVESNLKLFADYTEALDITAKYYYSSEVDKVYKDMGLSRSIFANWVDTGDEEKNKENFEQEMEKALDNNSDLVLSPLLEASSDSSTSRLHSRKTLISPRPAESTDDIYLDPATGLPSTTTVVEPSTTDVTGDSDSDTDDGSSGTVNNGGRETELNISDSDDAHSIINNLSSEVTDYDREVATSKAAHLLNAAISAGEPYLAASAFVGIESPVQQARIEGTGPVNELMNMLSAETSVSYTNVNTGEVETKKQSVLTTYNFVAAVSGGKYSTSEAANFARDRGLIATEMASQDIIKATTVSTNGQQKSNILLGIFGGEQADADRLGVLNDSIEMAMITKNSELIKSQVGGNRIVEGGSFLSNTINSHVIGAMPSDEEAIVAYNREARTEVARMAAAERATKSPFDISSPNTFMGSIAHGFANVMLQNGGNGGIVSSSVGTVAQMTNNSAKGIWGSVIADGEDDTDYGTTFGQYCDTVKSIGTEGDIYCTAHNIISTGYLDYDDDDWKDALGSENLDDSGGVVDKSDLSDFIVSGMGRWATVGVESVEVCERWHENHDNLLDDFLNTLSKLRKQYDVCKTNIDDDIGTGAKYAFIDDNEQAKQFAGYVLYDEVSSLLDGGVSKVTAYRDKYYEEHPLDNSRAGRIARISGLTKAEAEVALAYADYLTFIAKYNPAERYAFGRNLMVERPSEPLVDHANQVAVDLYIMWHGRTEYEDVRNRTRVV